MSEDGAPNNGAPVDDAPDDGTCSHQQGSSEYFDEDSALMDTTPGDILYICKLNKPGLFKRVEQNLSTNCIAFCMLVYS